MKKILTEAAAVGDVTARAISFHIRDKEAYYYPNSAWQLPFIGGYKFQTQPDVLNLYRVNMRKFSAFCPLEVDYAENVGIISGCAEIETSVKVVC